MRAAEVPEAREDGAGVRDPGVQKGRKVRTARMARLAATAHQVTEVVLCTRVNPGRQVNAGPRVIQAVLATQVRRGRVVPSGSEACQEQEVQLVCPGCRAKVASAFAQAATMQVSDSAAEQLRRKNG